MYKADYFSSVLGDAIPVRLAARSFIIPVPKDSGRLMVYPDDVEGCPELKKGMPILNKKGEPKGTGIVFTNYTDGKIVQGARDDGKEMIIINGISAEQAGQLLDYYNSIIPVPEKATEKNIRDILRYAHEDLGIDDLFNGDRHKIPSFEPESRHPHDSDCGVFIRRSNEERFALVGVGAGIFEGPASSPQRFEGNVVVVSNATRTWMVQTDAFLKTYRHPDDREIKLAELPAFAMHEKIPCRCSSPIP
jgi:hypothetical protein